MLALGRHRRQMEKSEGELRERVLGFINTKAEARDEAALVWLLQRTAIALLELYPPESAAETVRHHVGQALPGRSAG